jgi:hypothetical protein
MFKGGRPQTYPGLPGPLQLFPACLKSFSPGLTRNPPMMRWPSSFRLLPVLSEVPCLCIFVIPRGARKKTHTVLI